MYSDMLLIFDLLGGRKYKIHNIRRSKNLFLSNFPYYRPTKKFTPPPHPQYSIHQDVSLLLFLIERGYTLACPNEASL